jgi:ribosomal protein S18 acetylase RimI-like enzyme
LSVFPAADACPADPAGNGTAAPDQQKLCLKARDPRTGSVAQRLASRIIGGIKGAACGRRTYPLLQWDLVWYTEFVKLKNGKVQNEMKIRKAEEKDIPRLLALLGQVLQIHAEIRPDIFIPGTTKYTVCELAELMKQEDKPIYVAVNEDDVCMGYAFCQMQEQPFSTNMVPFKSLFIDDLCVDQQARGQHIGESLFEYVKQQAKEQGCYEVTLNVWAGNTPAEHFYEKMGMRTKERQMEYIL